MPEPKNQRTQPSGHVNDLDDLVTRIRACRICRDHPRGRALAHEPRPVLRVSSSASICVAGQAPGTRVHASGVPFTDPSGDRLRAWMGVEEATFYDADRIVIVPMGFCFPGLDRRGSDLPPRAECAPAWRKSLFDRMPGVDLIIAVGAYAHKWHLGERRRQTLTETVAAWQDIVEGAEAPQIMLCLIPPGETIPGSNEIRGSN